MKQRRRRRLCTVLALLVLLPTVFFLYQASSIWIYGQNDRAQRADCVIVLGAGLSSEGVSPVFRERINHAIALYRQGYAGKLILTGGRSEGSIYSDSYVASLYARSNGVPEEDILIEESSTVTEENLYYAKALMAEQGLHSAIVVSDPLHMKRVMAVADTLGLDACSSPTPTTRYRSFDKQLPFLLRETCYYIGYRLLHIFP